MDGAPAAVRFLPLAAALAAVAGLHALAPGFGGLTEGALARAVPTFLPAIAYGAACVALAGHAGAGPAWLRLPATLIAVMAFAAACLQPVFGGVVLGLGFAADEAARLNGASPLIARSAGILAAVLAYALLMSACERLAALRLRLPGRSGLRTALPHFAALVFAGAVLALPRLLGHDWGDVTRAPLSGRDALAMGLLTFGAFLPHAALGYFHARDAAREARLPPGG